jgi:alpha-tubulin suppressor-like RCC1 family protein
VVLALLVALSSFSVRPAAAAAAGTVEAWGSNSDGQLGNGSTGGSSDTPGQVSSLTDVKDVAAGGRHSLALKNDGTVWAWGNNFFGQLGDGNSGIDPDSDTGDAYVSDTPVQVKGEKGVGFLTNVKAIAAGGGHSLALKNGGTVRAWGKNFFGQLGNGNETDRKLPVTVTTPSGRPLRDVSAIAAGANHSLALKTNGRMRAWGFNGEGQLGTGNRNDRSVPATVRTSSGSALSGVEAIAGGETHSLALKSSGTVQAWGNNSNGELGDGNAPTDSTTPVPVSGLTNVEAIARGANARHGLAVVGP